DFKQAGNVVYLLGETRAELGGSLLLEHIGIDGGTAPAMPTNPPARYRALHQAIRAGLVQSCHDLSEGGLAVALAEMCLGGRLGVEIDTTGLKIEDWAHGDSGHGGASAQTNLQSSIFNLVLLFSESNGRLLVEVAPGDAAAFEACFGDDVALVRLGEVTSTPHMTIRAGGTTLTQLSIESMLEAWTGTW
ncbi:MAG: phosphoribosylformylglycinamidine synthase, partial [Caldilineaceae bacterium]|nr:phosphoribosylformylglycinamidine synthase [Caldilineaceae bacterium]